jgi:hypothetical protein
VSKFKVARSLMIVTKPDGTVVQKDVLVHFDEANQLFGIRIVGDSPLKGYVFELFQRELKRTRDAGTPMDTVPKE